MKKYLHISLLLLVANISTWATDVSNFVEFKAALEDATETSVTLVSDIALEDNINIVGTKSVDFGNYTLFANAYTLNIQANSNVIFNGTTGGINKSVASATLGCATISGVCTINGGMYVNSASSGTRQVIRCNAGSDLHITGGTFIAPTRVIAMAANSSIKMSAGKLYNSAYGIYALGANANIELTGGEINTTNSAICSASSINLLIADSAKVKGKDAFNLEKGFISITGGELIGTSGISIQLSNYQVASSKNIQISGGKFVGGISLSETLSTQKGFVVGGEWDEDVSNYCASGYSVEYINAHYYVRHDIVSVAEANGLIYSAGGYNFTGERHYTSVDSALQAAISAAGENGVVTLRGNISLFSPVSLDGSKTLNFNGYNIKTVNRGYLFVSAGESATIIGNGKLEAEVIGLKVEGKLVVNGGTFITNSTNDADKNVVIDCEGEAEIEINAGQINACYVGVSLTDNTVATINGGDIQGGIAILLNNQSGTSTTKCTINGGNIKGSTAIQVCGNGVYASNRTSYPNILEVKGGITYGMGSSGCGIYLIGKGAQLRMSNGTIRGNQYAIAGNGTNNSSTGKLYSDTEIHVSGGWVYAPTSGLGIYHPQYGVIEVTDSASITGGTAIGIKGGKLTIGEGAELHSTAVGHVVSSFNNGINMSGAALQIESHTSYAGNMEITIEDGAKLTSDGWYAIHEYVENTDDPTQVKSISVEGGKFVGGILVSKSLVNKGGFVKGGTWSEDVEAHCVEGKTTIPLETTDPDYNPYYYRVVDQTVKEIRKPAIVVNNSVDAVAAEAKRLAMGRDTTIFSGTGDHLVVYAPADVVTIAGENVEAKKLTIKSDAIFINDSASLTIGKGAIHIGDSMVTKTLEVYAGGTLVVDGLIYGASSNNYIIHSSEAKAANILYSPETQFISEDHPEATYRFTSKSFRKPKDDDSGDYVVIYQRFGMPTYNNNVTIKSLTTSGHMSTLRRYDYSSGWGPNNVFSSTSDYVLNDAEPFNSYMIGSSNPKTIAMDYDFIGKLMGNGDALLTYRKGWNYFANSYTGPIYIANYLHSIESSYPDGDVLASVYLYKDLGNDNFTWQPIIESMAGATVWERVNGKMQRVTYPAVIQPMQAFTMVNMVTTSREDSLLYKQHVYNPAMGIANAAPAMRQTSMPIDFMQLAVYNDSISDNVFLYEDARFSSDIDNGYDAVKHEGDQFLSFYAMQGNQPMQIVASSSLKDMYMGIRSNKAATYTLFMAGIHDAQYALVDTETGHTITMSEGMEYTFFAQAGTNDYRFRVVPIHSLPTAVDILESQVTLRIADNNLVIRENHGSDICVYTMNGQLVNRTPANGQDIQIVNLDELTAGSYVVRVADQALSFIK